LVLNKKNDDKKISKDSSSDIPRLSINERMQRDWDARAEIDPKFFIKSIHKQTDSEFWKSGFIDRDNVLGAGTQRHNQILEKKDPQKMKVLEIGCGIGRLLIPMSEIFGEVIGVDVSQKIVEIGQNYIKNIPNCSIIKNNGLDLSMFSDDHFDFCYSFIVFQHIPEKKIVENYIREVSRILKSGCIFQFQVHGDDNWKSDFTDTWHGVHFTSEEIHKIAKENRFEILEETGNKEQYYWLTFKSIK